MRGPWKQDVTMFLIERLRFDRCVYSIPLLGWKIKVLKFNSLFPPISYVIPGSYFVSLNLSFYIFSKTETASQSCNSTGNYLQSD